MVKLGDLCAPNMGSLDPRKYPDESFDLYSIPAFDSRNPDCVKGLEVGSSKKCVEDGDLLLSRIVPHIRRAWVVSRTSKNRMIASSEWLIFRRDDIEANFLRHLLISDHFHQQFMATVSGVGGSLLRARPAQVFEIQIPIPFKNGKPDLAEQKRIAAILDKADGIRRKRREALQLADDFLRSCFLDMFGDPVTNPKGWDRKALGELGTLERGASKHRPRNEPSLLGGDYPLIQTGDVANSEGYIRTYKSTYSEKGLKQSKMWPKGTLCITIAANIGSTGILTFDSCFPDSVVGFCSDQEGRSEYVQGLFWFLKKILDEQAPQVAQKNINLKILRELQVPSPPNDLQMKFANAVRSTEALRQRMKSEEDTNLFSSLQQSAFKGEL